MSKRDVYADRAALKYARVKGRAAWDIERKRQGRCCCDTCFQAHDVIVRAAAKAIAASPETDEA